MGETQICSQEPVCSSNLPRIRQWHMEDNNPGLQAPGTCSLPSPSQAMDPHKYSQTIHIPLFDTPCSVLRSVPLLHDTSQFFSFVRKRGSLGDEAKGAGGVCFLLLVHFCSLPFTNSLLMWELPGAMVSALQGFCDVAQVNMVKMPAVR